MRRRQGNAAFAHRDVIENTLAALAFIICVIGDFYLCRNVMPNSDSIQSFNELPSIWRGNFLLHGWAVNSDNFYVSDLILFIILRAVFGFRLGLIYLEPAMVFAGILFVSAWLIQRCGGARPGLRCIALFYLIGVPFAPGLFVLLLPDYHIATIALSLCALLIIEPSLSSRRPDRGAAMPFFLFALGAAASDPMASVFFLVPVTLFFLTRWIRNGGLAPGEREILLATVLAGIAALEFPAAIAAAGGFSTHQPFTRSIVTLPELFENARAVAAAMQILFSARPADGAGVVDQALVMTRLCVLAVVLSLCVRTGWRAWRGDSHAVARLLLLGAICLAVADLLSTAFTKAIGPGTGFPDAEVRYATPVALFLAVAAVIEAGELPDFGWTRGRSLVAAAIVLLFGGCFLFGAAQAVLPAARQPPAITLAPQAALAQWLAARNLHYGFGDYWTASMVKAISLDHVVVDSVWVHDGIQPYPWLADTARMNAHEPPQFVVFSQGNVAGITLALVEAAYGKPRKVERLGMYVIFFPQ